MRFLPFLSHSVVVASVCFLAAFVGSAQSLAAGVGLMAPPMKGNTVAETRPPMPSHHRRTDDQLIYARVRDGVYTVDGMVAKIELNYDVQGANFLYLFVPGVGTAVVSVSPEPDAILTTAALHEDELAFVADGHHFDLTGISLATDKGQVPSHLFVRLDRSAWRLSRMPMIGFGQRGELPYEWPGALPPEHAEESEFMPSIPATLLPTPLPAAPAGVPARSKPVNPASLHPVVLR